MIGAMKETTLQILHMIGVFLATIALLAFAYQHGYEAGQRDAYCDVLHGPQP